MKTKSCICIGRELGAGGREVARLLSERLSIPVYDKELLTRASLETGLSQEVFEQKDERSFLTTLRTLFSGNIVGEGAVSVLSEDQLFQWQSEAIRTIASEGPAIFLGRCADYVLRDQPNVLSVFLTANPTDRVARLVASLGITEKEAQECIEKGDRKRASYYNFYTFKKWGAATSYDVCLNTSLFGVERVADLIVNLLG
ncbi:MAG: cytidylate kinase-like family protein [Bacteroidales bacterium]|nr:cytidylate kinase-like family protein [Bacteroidales bacterium]